MQELQSQPPVHHPSDVIGSWGPLQRRIFFAIVTLYCVAPFSNSVIVFITPKQDFWCVDTDPVTGSAVHLKGSCFLDYENKTKCTKFEYDKAKFKRTLITEFDLVCDRAWLGSAAQSLHQIGYMVSGIGLGLISDRYGRLFCAKLSISLEIVAGLGQAFAPSIYLYMIARFFVGIAAYGRFLNSYVLLSEWVGPKIRAKIAAVSGYGWTAGSMLLPFVFYHIPDYFKVQIFATTFEIIGFIAYIIIVYESPKFLMTHGRYQEAEEILTKAALEADRLSSDEVKSRIQQLKDHVSEEEERAKKKEKSGRYSVLAVWSDPDLLRLSLILYFTWFSTAFISYAFFLNVGNLGGSLYWNVFIFAVAGGVENAISYIILPRFERRTILVTSLVVTAFGLFCVLACSFNDSLITPRIVFSFLFSISLGVTFGTVYIYTTETFPTTMRQASLGTCSIFARIGSVIAPFIKELTLATHLSVSLIIFASLSVVNALLMMMLPDTTDIQLPDNILQSKEVVEKDHRRLSIVHLRRMSRVSATGEKREAVDSVN